ncbi:MAG: energy transducer TonB [Altibacter sp.]|nr:energy transducer TonB [Altibacter sp.]
MRSLVNIFKSNQPKMLSKREDKKRININWNSRLFFQLGIIASLLAVFVVMESTIGLTPVDRTIADDFYLEEPPIYDIVIQNESPAPVVPPKKEVKITKPVKKVPLVNIKPIDNSSPAISESPTEPTDVTPKDPVVVATPPVAVTPKDTNPKSILGVEFAPVFPGCESQSNNKERVDCMSSKINQFISKKFDVDKFSGYDARNPLRISVTFKIDEQGYVTDIRARAADSKLENEAKRVIDQLPKMRPGKQGDENVSVLYTVPITLRIQ